MYSYKEKHSTGAFLHDESPPEASFSFTFLQLLSYLTLQLDTTDIVYCCLVVSRFNPKRSPFVHCGNSTENCFRLGIPGTGPSSSMPLCPDGKWFSTQSSMPSAWIFTMRRCGQGRRGSLIEGLGSSVRCVMLTDRL